MTDQEKFVEEINKAFTIDWSDIEPGVYAGHVGGFGD